MQKFVNLILSYILVNWVHFTFIYSRGTMNKQYLLISSLLLVLFTFPIVYSATESGTVELTTKLDIKELPMLQYLNNREAMVYFGYVGCLDSCPKAFKNLTNHHTSASSIYFVNLIPGLTNADVQNYVDTWPEAKGIIGIQASLKDLSHIEEYFGNFQAGRIGVYNPKLHTDQVFLLKKNTANEWEVTKRFSSSAISAL